MTYNPSETICQKVGHVTAVVHYNNNHTSAINNTISPSDVALSSDISFALSQGPVMNEPLIL